MSEDSNSFAIVTDSAADISQFIKEQEGVFFVNNFVVLDDKELVEGVDISREEFLSELNNGKLATTSQASPEMMVDGYQKALNSHACVLGIHVGGKLSGVLNNANIAVKRLKKDIVLFDTDSVSIGITYFIELAIKCRARGLSREETISILEQAKTQVYIQVLLGDLKYIRHGGRLNASQFFLLNLLKVKPIIKVEDGIIEKDGGALGIKRAINTMFQRGIKNAGHIKNPYIAVGSVGADREMEALLARFVQALQPSDVRKTGLSPVIIAHVGPYGLGYAIAPAFDSYFDNLD